MSLAVIENAHQKHSLGSNNHEERMSITLSITIVCFFFKMSLEENLEVNR